MRSHGFLKCHIGLYNHCDEIYAIVGPRLQIPDRAVDFDITIIVNGTKIYKPKATRMRRGWGWEYTESRGESRNLR